ncbi:Uncharacterised protein [Mycobacteroides abscessus subsp. abscessus]|nr:Uncharacterised protein [Mycobacteroides abscessus subsp. abscessus]
MVCKDRQTAGLVTNYGPCGELIAPLAGPVTLLVRCDQLPVNRFECAIPQDLQLPFAREVVADIAIEDLAGATLSRIADPDEDGDSVAAAGAEHLAALAFRLLSGRSLIAPKVIDVDS